MAQNPPAARALPEAALCETVSAYLRAQGWEVVSELPFIYGSLDLAAVKDGKIMGLEAKTAFTWKLRQQVNRCTLYLDQAVAVVGTKPRPKALDWARKVGAGVWRVENGRVEVLVEPRQNHRPPHGARDRALARFQHMPKDVDGGKPCLKGKGPALATAERVREYLLAHPEASWKEIFAQVPNHYLSAASMRGAMLGKTSILELWEKRKPAATAPSVQPQ